MALLYTNRIVNYANCDVPLLKANKWIGICVSYLTSSSTDKLNISICINCSTITY
jgi:hypothetical protein